MQSRFQITTREAEILALLAKGLEDKEIVLVLNMSRGTLRTHLSRLFNKSGLGRRSSLAAMWIASHQTSLYTVAPSSAGLSKQRQFRTHNEGRT